MPATQGELFTRVPVDLFRKGNASGPRLDHIRADDLDVVDVTLANGDVVTMVHPNGGLSTVPMFTVQGGSGESQTGGR